MKNIIIKGVFLEAKTKGIDGQKLVDSAKEAIFLLIVNKKVDVCKQN